MFEHKIVAARVHDRLQILLTPYLHVIRGPDYCIFIIVYVDDLLDN
jgi:hypothetical protein